MVLPAPADVPPIVFPVAPLVLVTPTVFGRGAVPPTSAPIRLPCTRIPEALLKMKTPLPIFPEMTFLAPAVVPPTELLDAVGPMATPELPLPSAADPAAFVPMKLPCTRLANVLLMIATPASELAEMRFDAAAAVPPIRAFNAPSTTTPLFEFPAPALPVIDVPIKFRSTIALDAFIEIDMPLPENRFITSPLIVVPGAVTISPSAEGAFNPFTSMIGLPAKPGWVVPSMVTESVIAGSSENTSNVCWPPPPMLKVIRSAPALAFASMIACLNDGRPRLSLVVLTTIVIAGAVITTDGEISLRRRITRSLCASALRRIGSTAIGSPSTSSDSLITANRYFWKSGAWRATSCNWCAFESITTRLSVRILEL